MQGFDFYKEFHLLEIDRKNSLDEKVNLPILILSILVSVNVFIFSQNSIKEFLCFYIVIGFLILISIIFSIVFLGKSYSNFFFSHYYKELAVMNDILMYEEGLTNEGREDKEEIFKNYMKRELAGCATENFNINKKRTVSLARCKQSLFITLSLTIILALFYVVSLLVNI